MAWYWLYKSVLMAHYSKPNSGTCDNSYKLASGHTMGLAFPRHGSRPELHWKHGKNDTSAKNIHSCPNDQLASTRGAHTGKWTFHVFDREPWAGAALHVFGPTNGQWWKAISMDKSGLQTSGRVTYTQQQQHMLKEDMTKPIKGILRENVRDGH